MTILVELVDIRRFATLDELASYLGLAPGTHSSGATETTTGMSHQGNSHVRYLLIEAAWIAARHDPALLKTFTELTRRMPKTKAIVRIAHKLLNRPAKAGY
jgi:transposase